jgi:NAD(P)-dependent dehydrogenase (short-subunit alcohol dehydrogenase family)
MEIGIKDKVAIITGGGQGIGRVIVRILAKEGAKMVIGDVNTDAANRVLKEVNDFGGDAFVVETDVRKLEEWISWYITLLFLALSPSWILRLKYGET